MPRFVEDEEREALNIPISLGEMEATLKIFSKDKSLGPDGWPIEFYTTFFDLIGQDLLLVIEDYGTTGRMSEAFNSTFIALIPKVDKPQYFDDFRPISLCNCVYKMTSKIITSLRERLGSSSHMDNSLCMRPGVRVSESQSLTIFDPIHSHA